MIKAASLDIDVNLKDFSTYLDQQGIEHRIIEESGSQVIWASNQPFADTIVKLLDQWQTGEIRFENRASPTTLRPLRATGLVNRLWHAIFASPVTLGLMIISLVVAVVSQLGYAAHRVDFLFYPLLASDSLPALLAGIDSLGELLRTLAPMFLHFSELHIVFNLLWLWYFGKQLERVQPSWLFLGIVLLLAFVSNTTQYMYSNQANFGGMSGVVYGLVGYAWLINTLVPGYRLMLNNAMFGFFVVALVVMEVVAGSWIATAAHIGGLLTGLLLALLVVLYTRLVPGKVI
ncbi:MAG: rhomboid family intramembrane serine protease [Pseudohongiellaceae bacterium]